MSKTIIYIVGCGHSGSTLLDMILDTSDQIFGMGELYLLKPYLNENNPDNYLRGNPCACGIKNFTKCDEWRNILVTYTNNGHHIADLDLRVERIEGLLLFLGVHSKKIDYERHFFKSVFDSKTINVVIDSSNSPLRLIRLARLSKEYNVKVIHLTKDVRSYVKSMTQIGFSTRKSIWLWITVNVFTLFLKKFDRNIRQLDWIKLSYDLYATKPKTYLGRVFSFIGIEFTENYLNYWKVDHHNLGGNPMRIDPKPIYSPPSELYKISGLPYLCIYKLFLRRLNKALVWYE